MSRVIDMTGQQIGHLTVIGRDHGPHKTTQAYWRCQCSCGNEIVVEGRNLRRGFPRDCGCGSDPNSQISNKTTNYNQHLIIDLTGQRFGSWTVIERDYGEHPSRGGYWKCKCDCGTERVVSSNSLRQGKSTNCGCLGHNQLIDLTGQQFGEWTVLYKIEDQPNAWQCRCSCGTEKVHTSYTLRSGRSLSCGCKLISKGENRIEELLINNNINYETQKTFSTCKNIKQLKFDFYLVDYNTLIEYDGAQHFKEIKPWGGEEKLLDTQKHDKIKNQWCQENNITLIRIPYTHLKEICLEDLLPETSTFIYYKALSTEDIIKLKNL